MGKESITIFSRFTRIQKNLHIPAIYLWKRGISLQVECLPTSVEGRQGALLLRLTTTMTGYSSKRTSEAQCVTTC